MSKTDDIKRNSNKIWLAGLGAYALIQESGNENFDKLVEKGKVFEEENQESADNKTARLAG